MPNLETVLDDHVAIVAVGLKFCNNILSLDDLWTTLQHDQCTRKELIGHSRWKSEASGEPQADAKRLQGRSASLMDALDEFDAAYFGISNSEAESMDPHQRLLLETVEKTLAQYQVSNGKEIMLRCDNPDEVRTSVYVGMSSTEYQSVLKGSTSVYSATGGALSVAAGRIAYFHGWQGAAMVVNTAGSSSLVALHQACAALKKNECCRAVVAGASFMLSPAEVPKEYCRGEGCGAVILKRLADAERDGDCIYGVIRGSAVMQDGKSASTSPLTGSSIQTQVLRAALSDAGVSAADVCYVEAHGTGTKLGDPIEMEALAAVYSSGDHGSGSSSDDRAALPVYVGSVKANIGHLESAAGMAGLFAALTTLQHGEAPPSSVIAGSVSSKTVTVTSAPVGAVPRLLLSGRQDQSLFAGVSAFGNNGSLAHLILEIPRRHSRMYGSSSSPTSFSCSAKDLIPHYNPVPVPYHRVKMERRTIFHAPIPMVTTATITTPATPTVLTTAAKQRAGRDDVAIVALSCQLPGDAIDLPSLWSVLQSKRDCITEVAVTRWDTDAIKAHYADQADPDMLDRIRYGGFLSDAVLHEKPQSTRISSNCGAKEASGDGYEFLLASVQKKLAATEDLSHRLLLRGVLSAIDDYAARNETGVVDNSNNNSNGNKNGDDLTTAPVRVTSENVAWYFRSRVTGVFVGGPGLLNTTTAEGYCAQNIHHPVSSALSEAASKVAEALDLTGSCLVTDTACSSSLVALHLAVRSLQRGECSVAIAAAVHLIRLEMSMACAVAGMLSPDGRCHTFDEAGNGYCRGEGCGAVILKRLADAERDGDCIYGVIRGSAVMQDGKSASLTAPNGRAQEELMRTALSDAGVSAADVCYVEAHGTGTKLGDPIETEALAAVYGSGVHGSGSSSDDRAAPPVYVGSVKANIGHLESAAGMAGLFAALATLQHAIVPPNGQLRTLNGKVAKTVKGTRIVFPTESVTLPLSSSVHSSSQPHFPDSLFAAVSSFGYSGTIGHIILEVSPSRSRFLSEEAAVYNNGTSVPSQQVFQPQPHCMVQFWESAVPGRSVAISYIHSHLSKRLCAQHGAVTAQPSDFTLAMLLELLVATLGRAHGYCSELKVDRIRYFPRNIAPVAEKLRRSLAGNDDSDNDADSPVQLFCVLDTTANCSIQLYCSSDRVEGSKSPSVSLTEKLRLVKAPRQKSLLLTANYSTVAMGDVHAAPTDFVLFTQALELIATSPVIDSETGNVANGNSKMLITSLDVTLASLPQQCQESNITLALERRFWPEALYQSLGVNAVGCSSTGCSLLPALSAKDVVDMIRHELLAVTGIQCVLPCTASSTATCPSTKLDKDSNAIENVVTVDSCLLDAMDSLGAIELSARLAMVFKPYCREPVLPTLLYLHPSVQQMANYFLGLGFDLSSSTSREKEELDSKVTDSAGVAGTFTTYPCLGTDKDGSTRVPSGRMVVFGGQMQHASAWREIAEHWNSGIGSEAGRKGLSVHVFNMPGRFERAGEPSATTVCELVRDVCMQIYAEGWLLDHVPLYVLGYSFGACLAYETVHFLEHRLQHELANCGFGTVTAPASSIEAIDLAAPRLLRTVSHLFLVAGPTRADLQDVRLFGNTAESFRAALLANLGVVPHTFTEFLAANISSPEVVTQVLSWGVQDQMYQQQWCQMFDSRTDEMNKVSCHITCLTGSDDGAVECEGWKPFVSEGFQYEARFYPGNHFFIFDSQAVDRNIALDVMESLGSA